MAQETEFLRGLRADLASSEEGDPGVAKGGSSFLQGLRKDLGTLAPKAPPEEPGFFSGVTENLGSEIALATEKSYRGIGAGLASDLGTAPEPDPLSLPGRYTMGPAAAYNLAQDAVREIISRTPLGAQLREDAQSQIARAREIDREVASVRPENLSVMQEGVRSGVVSFAQNLPTMVAALATRSPTVATTGASALVAGDSYATARAEGLDHSQAANYAGVDAVIEAATEVLPNMVLVRALGGKGGEGRQEIAKTLRDFALTEIPGEQLATFFQSLNAYSNGLDPELEQAIDEGDYGRAGEIQAERQLITSIATIVGGGAQLGVTAGARRLTAPPQSPPTDTTPETQSAAPLEGTPDRGEGSLTPKQQENLRRLRKLQELNLAPTGQKDLIPKGLPDQSAQAEPTPSLLEEVVFEEDAQGDADAPVAEAPVRTQADQALEIIRESENPTTSDVQRGLKVGFNKTQEILKNLSDRGLIDPDTTGGIKLVDAPASQPGQVAGPILIDAKAVVETAKDEKFEAQWAVIDASQLVSSHNADGTENPDYPQDLQPRDRTRAALVLQIDQLARKMTPERMGDTGVAEMGAPVVGPDFVVESGNGRSAAIKRLYAEGKAEAYADYVREQARMRGVSDEQLAGIPNPVLVRRRTKDISVKKRQALGRDGNAPSVAAMSASETARADAEMISDEMMSSFFPSEDGDIDNSANRPFILKFVSELGLTQAAGLLSDSGGVTAGLVNRIRNAVFARAYGDARLVTAITEDTKPEAKNILNALQLAAPSFARARAMESESSTLSSDLIGSIVGAVQVLEEARRSGMVLDEFERQQGMFGAVDPRVITLAKQLDANKRAPKKMGTLLSDMAGFLEVAAKQSQSGSLFGDQLEETTVDTIIDGAISRFEGQVNAGQPQDLFAQTANRPDVLPDAGSSNAQREPEAPGRAADAPPEGGNRVPEEGPDGPSLFKRIDFEQSPGSFRYAGRITSIPKVRFIRAASVGTPDSVVYSQAEDVVSNGYRGNQIPSFARNELAAAMEDLSEIGITTELIGNLAQNGIVAFDTTDGTVGYFDYQAGVVGINSQLFADLASDTSGDRSEYKQNLRRVLRSTLAHEVGHAVDFNMAQGRGLAARMVQSSFGFQAQQQNGELIVDGKPLFNEAAEQWRGGELSEYYTYPLNLIEGMLKDGGGQVSQEDQVLIARELFAQSYALYYTDREALRRNMPQTFAVIQDAAETASQRFNGGRNGVQLDSNRRRESAPAGDGFVRSEIRTPGPVGRDQDGGAQRNDQSPNRQDQLFYQGREAESALGRDQGPASPRESSELNEAPDPVQGGLNFNYESARAEGGMLSDREPSNLYNLADETVVEWGRRWIQDKMLRMRLQLEKIKDVNGLDQLDEAVDVSLKETLYYGKVGEDFRRIEKMFDRAVDVMKRAKLSIEELGLYMYAMHAPERNQFIADKRREAIARYEQAKAEGRTPQGLPPEPMDDGGSGMTNQEADQILLRFDQEGKTEELREASKVIYEILQDARDRLNEAGMIDEETQVKWESTFDFYVSLQGFEEESKTPVVGRARTGSGFSIGGNESMAALGRRTKAANPVLNSLRLAQEKAMRIRKNEVAVSMLDLALEYPDSTSWKVYADGNGPFEDIPGPGGSVVRQRINMRTARRQDSGEKRFMMAKIDGGTYFIEIKDRLLNRAMQNAGASNSDEISNWVMKFVGGFTRLMSQMSTTYNPEFFMQNAPRDMTTGIYAALAEQDRADGKLSGKKIALEIPKLWFAAGSAFWRNARGKRGSTPEQILFDRYAQEFRESGGMTGWANLLDLEKEAKRINALTAINGKSSMADVKRTARQIMDLIEDFNGAFENAARLSAYVASRKQGVSAEKAADLAKGLTVNFNRRGEATAWVNSFYMFFNAAIQGNMNVIRSLTGRRKDGKLTAAQRLAMYSVGVSVGLAVLNRMISGEDDEGNLHYDMINQSEKDRNIIIMNPFDGETTFKIPLPYGFSVLHNIGTEYTDAYFSPRKSALDATANVFAAFLGSFSPLSVGASPDGIVTTALKSATPTIVKPVVEIAINENNWGSAIYPERFPNQEHLPNSVLYRPRTSETSVAIAQFLNKISGGDTYIEGKLDIRPDVLDYLASFYAAGLGRFAMRSINFADKAIAGEMDKLENRQYPVLRLIYGQPSKYEHLDTYYNNRNKILQYVEQRDDKRGVDRINFQRENAKLLRLEERLKASDKELRQIRKAKRNAENYMSEERYEEYEERMVEREYKVYRRFNALFAKAVGED